MLILKAYPSNDPYIVLRNLHTGETIGLYCPPSEAHSSIGIDAPQHWRIERVYRDRPEKDRKQQEATE